MLARLEKAPKKESAPGYLFVTLQSMELFLCGRVWRATDKCAGTGHVDEKKGMA